MMQSCESFGSDTSLAKMDKQTDMGDMGRACPTLARDAGDGLYMFRAEKHSSNCTLVVTLLDNDSKAMELALSLEKLTNEKLLNLHEARDTYCCLCLVASRNNDLQLADFVESEFLVEREEVQYGLLGCLKVGVLEESTELGQMKIMRSLHRRSSIMSLKNVHGKQKEMAAGRHDEELEEMSFEQLKV
ncbi:ferritin-2, chloroplastic [Tanacetum coccineum]